MKPRFIGIGLTLVFAGTALSGVAHYDGVLGATSPEELLKPDAPDPVLVRVEVQGTPTEAESRFAVLLADLVVPPDMQSRMRTGTYVTVRFVDGPAEPGFLAYEGDPPAPGRLLVVEGSAATHWPLVRGLDGSFEAVPVVFLEPVDYHAPLLFRE